MTTLHQVLSDVRDPYVGYFRAVVRNERAQRFGFLMRKQGVSPELIIQIGDGSNPHGSRFNLPFRPDLMRKKPADDAKPEVVALEMGAPPEFAPFEATLPNGVSAQFFPFEWNHCDISCDGDADDWQPCLDWFERWFDRGEQRPADADGLHGVIHEMTEPQATGGAVAFSVDLGSASMEALLELLTVLHQKGMTRIRVGTFFARGS